MNLYRLALLALLLSATTAHASDGCGDDCQSQPASLTPAEQWSAATAGMSGRAVWAHIVAGESGHLPDGAQLVAWTLRAWEVYQGMPATMAGPRWGWYGWKQPYAVDYAAVDAAWGQPISASPYAWMRAGRYCRLLGSDTDVRYWRSLGWDVGIHVRLEWPEWAMAMNCVW